MDELGRLDHLGVGELSLVLAKGTASHRASRALSSLSLLSSPTHMVVSKPTL